MGPETPPQVTTSTSTKDGTPFVGVKEGGGDTLVPPSPQNIGPNHWVQAPKWGSGREEGEKKKKNEAIRGSPRACENLGAGPSPANAPPETASSSACPYSGHSARDPPLAPYPMVAGSLPPRPPHQARNPHWPPPSVSGALPQLPLAPEGPNCISSNLCLLSM